MNKNVLILGADGMLGRVAFLYLKSKFPQNVWGTTRKKGDKTKSMFSLTVQNHHKDLTLIVKKLKKIDYIINCIGILKDDHLREELIYTNALFPHFLEKLAEENKFKLIHISTDAVFPPLSGKVNELSTIGPVDYYGCSKLLGETISKNAITFRSSFIGLDPINHKGLLEWVLKTKNIAGYTNQQWSGCTTLQFAKFCESLILNGKFDQLREKTNIYHFVPLKPISKFNLIKTFTKIINKNLSINMSEGIKRTRILDTNYSTILNMGSHTDDLTVAIKEIIAFENTL